MAMHFVTVEMGTGLPVGNSMCWKYAADVTGITFTHYNSDVINSIRVDGNYIGKEVAFYANGSRSVFLGDIKKPHDERKAILWNHGFRKRFFVKPVDIQDAGTWDDLIEVKCGRLEGSTYGFNEHGQFVNAINVKKTVVTDEYGEIMVATGFGKEYNSDHVCRVVYLNPKATVDHVKAWERQFIA